MRKFGDVGAEDGAAVPVGTVLRSKSIPVVITAPGRAGPLGPARRLGAATNGSANGFDAVQRDASAPREGPARSKTRRSVITRASHLHGRRTSRPALDFLGSGRRERSDRSTRRVEHPQGCWREHA